MVSESKAESRPKPASKAQSESTPKLGGQASDFRSAVGGVVGPTLSPGPEWSTGSPELFRTAPRLPVESSRMTDEPRLVLDLFPFHLAHIK